MMSQARFDSIASGLNSAARKVYDAVPMTEPWTAVQVGAELRRSSIGMSAHTIGGCLNTLLRAGLISEPDKGTFMREPIRKASTKKDKPKEEVQVQQITIKPAAKAVAPVAPAPVAAAAANPLDILGALSQRVAKMGGEMKELASDISDAAVEIQSQMDTSEENVKKLRQLQQLLKSLEMTA